MQKIIYILIFLTFGIIHSNAQNIYIKRSDVDSARYNFITASYPFTLDIYISNLPKTNGVAFELDYNMSNFVKFSQWKYGDYYSNPQVVAFEDTNGRGRLIVAVSTDDNIQADSNITPKVISLEFVTIQNAINNTTNIFNFVKPVATVIDSNGRHTVFLKADTTYLNIHGYVSVWPGDTDNNGIVDHLDFAPVTQYIGFGSATKNMKSFKRKSGSAIWGPHKVLTWDSAAVTYADCDGNGDITISDMLIVTYNLGKDTTSYSINKTKDAIQSKLPKPTYYNVDNAIRIPLKLNKNIELYGIAGIIDISQFSDKIIGVEPGNIFVYNPYNYSIIKDNKLNFALGSYSRELSLNNGIIGNIVASNDLKYNINDYIVELKGIDKNGNIIELNSLSDIEAGSEIKNKISSSNIGFDAEMEYIYIYDLLGNSIYNYSNTNNINTESWPQGIYVVQVKNRQATKTFKYIKSN